MGEPSINGDMPSSAFLSHATSYPVVSDTLTTIKDNQYAAKGIDIANTAYAKLVKPTFPLLQTPYEYTKPYIAKADSFGDSILTKVDEKVPIVKSETAEIKSTVADLVNWPFKKVDEVKSYAFTTYGDEYKKCGGDGYVAGGKALITSSMVITSDVLGWVSSFIAAKKEESKDMAQEAKEKAQY